MGAEVNPEEADKAFAANREPSQMVKDYARLLVRIGDLEAEVAAFRATHSWLDFYDSQECVGDYSCEYPNHASTCLWADKQ